MKKSIISVLLGLMVAVIVAPSAFATDVPANLLVTRNGHEWAWASPCPPVANVGCGNNLTMHDGFTVATMADWQADFTGRADVYNAFVVGGIKCASSYFDSIYAGICNDGDLSIGAVWNFPQGANWDYLGFNNTNNLDTWVIRGGNQGVPEPGSLALLGTGLAALWFRKRSA